MSCIKLTHIRCDEGNPNYAQIICYPNLESDKFSIVYFVIEFSVIYIYMN